MSDVKTPSQADIQAKTTRVYAMGLIAEALVASGIERPTAHVMAADAVASVLAHGISFVRRGE